MDRMATGDYRRRARRLRHVLAKRPGELHRQLRKLAREHDRPSPAVVTEKSYEPDSKAKLFACFVHGAMDGSVIRYSKRQQLLRVGAQLGIKRFEANLIVAAVEHAGRGAGVAPAPVVQHQPQPSSRRVGTAATLSVVILTQVLIGIACWWLLAR